MGKSCRAVRSGADRPSYPSAVAGPIGSPELLQYSYIGDTPLRGKRETLPLWPVGAKR